MNCKTLSLCIAVLICLAALPFLLSSTAFGNGCGINPLGDTSGDTDFYVSKNQNQGGSGVSSTAQSAPAKAAVALGAVAKADQNATIQSLNPDRPSPQSPGVAIVWKVEASNPNNEKMLYDFLLTGPSTGGQLKDETGWIAESFWTWNTTDADAGESQIEVRVMRSGSAGFEDSKAQSYVVAAVSVASNSTSNNASASVSNSVSNTASSAVDFHPESKTSEPIFQQAESCARREVGRSIIIQRAQYANARSNTQGHHRGSSRDCCGYAGTGRAAGARNHGCGGQMDDKAGE